MMMPRVLTKYQAHSKVEVLITRPGVGLVIAGQLAAESRYEQPQMPAIRLALQLAGILYKSTLFLQNKPNFRKGGMNVSAIVKKDYENIQQWKLPDNKLNQSQFRSPIYPWELPYLCCVHCKKECEFLCLPALETSA